MKAVLFDLDGVLYEGGRPIPGATEAVRAFQHRGVPHLFLTNTTSKPRRALVEKLAGFGIETDTDHLLTPPVAAADWLRAHVTGPVLLLAPETIREEFSGVELAPAGAEAVAALVIGDLGEGWDFATLNHAFRLLMNQPPPLLLALGMTRYWRAADGLRLDVAPFVTALSHASGVEPVVLGKPAAPYYQAALAHLGIAPTQTVMIGDDIRGDVEAAQRLGMKALLVRTGKFQPRDLSLGITPDGVLDSVRELPEWWAARTGGISTDV